MELFQKHEIKESDGRHEILLFLNKKQLPKELEDDCLHITIKEKATAYIQENNIHIPIEVVRIMIGSVLFFSFALNRKRDREGSDPSLSR